jgi:BioD-like phosphotransacetylase family protein
MVVMGLGLELQKQGFTIGYMKPVGAVPVTTGRCLADEDAIFVQEVLGLSEDPCLVTPVVVTSEFMAQAFRGECSDLMPQIRSAYDKLAQGKDVVLVAGSGSMNSGRYCHLDGVSVVKSLGIKCVIIDRFAKELKYDYLLVQKEALGDSLVGVVLNDIPASAMDEVQNLIVPFLERTGIKVLGIIPKDPLMGAIKVGSLASRLGGKVISATGKTDRVVENFLIGTMQVENFLTHFRRNKNAAVIVGGDRSDVQLVALEGGCPCLVLTGNLYPNDIIITRSEVLEIPIIIVREDTFTVAKKMEAILERHKLRDMIKIRQGASLVAHNVDIQHIKQAIGLK